MKSCFYCNYTFAGPARHFLWLNCNKLTYFGGKI